MRFLSIRADADKCGQAQHDDRSRDVARGLRFAAIGVACVWSVGGVSSALAQLPQAPAGVEVTTIHGIEFSTIGNPGNRLPTREEVRGDAERDRGSVGRTFALARTELTAAQYLPFIRAYADAFPDRTLSPLESSWYIRRQTASGPLEVVQGFENWAIEVTFEMGMRYCNWLQNDRVGGADGIERGVYDMSLIRIDPSGVQTDTITRAANARFWLPSVDEWIKATYFDPNRYGPDADGYWFYPHRSELEPIPGVDSDVGIRMSNAGPVGRFPNSQSPWGLLDVSGGVTEWTDEARSGPSSNRLIMGSGIGSLPIFDELPINTRPTFGSHRVNSGIRIATIPTPSAALIAAVSAMFSWNTRRRS